jgi:4-amino-4-deoxy-L-arabinose transferase-like glycosyltransferase
MSLASVARSDSMIALRVRQAIRPMLPLILILLWTLVLRLPFAWETDKDEFFFSVIATEWMRGGLPYVASFDIKPPGLFFLFVVAQSLFGTSLATIKGLEIVAVVAGSFTLYRMLLGMGTASMARMAATLFPLYTVTMDGTIVVNLVLQLPFIILAFAGLLGAVGPRATTDRARLWSAFLGGLAIGAAGMVKQTAVFEAAAAVAMLVALGGTRRWFLAALFIVGAAIVPAAFFVYFAAAGHFHEMYNAIVTLAAARTDSDVLAVYGPDLAYNFTPLGVFWNMLAGSGPLILLWGGAGFIALRYRRVAAHVSPSLLLVAVTWFVVAFVGAMAGLGLSRYYLLTTVPPLIVLASAFFCHGNDVAERDQFRAFVAVVVAAVVSIAYVDHKQLFDPPAFVAGDYDATRELGADILALNPSQDDRMLVLNRGFAVYAETGLLPPTPVFHAHHLLGVFHTPVADPLGVALAANPRFIVIADPTTWHITERRSQIDRALAYVAAHYRVAAEVNGAKDSFTLYEFRG